jgi:hypothetical protein
MIVVVIAYENKLLLSSAIISIFTKALFQF